MSNSNKVSTIKDPVPEVIRHAADYSLVKVAGVPMIHNIRFDKYFRLSRAAFIRLKRITSDREFNIRADERYSLAQEVVSVLQGS